jgi:sigma-B regulation protein RsbU (phosphoserine phosphatase)
MTEPAPPFALIIPSDLRLLPLARSFVETVCQAVACERAVCDAILLAINEALQNVIRHAHRGCREASVQLQCFPAGDGLEVVILDEGDPFDIEAVPVMDPAEIRVGGRGVFLMRKLMDELSCQPRPGRGNRLRMVKRFAQSCWTPRAS